MPGEQTTGVRKALHHLEHARRHAGFEQYLLELHGAERRDLGGLEDHGIAARERGRRLPAGDLQRIVPSTDAGDDPQRLAPCIAECLAAQIDVLAAQGLREACEVLEAVRARNDVDDERLLNRLAGVARLELGQLAVTRAQDLRGLPQHAGALRARHRRPAHLTTLRGAHGGVDIGRAGNARVP